MSGWLHELADRAPDHARAIIDFDGAVYSYGDLRRESAALQDRLRAHGIRPGDRVMVVTENSAVFAICALALSRMAAWILPVNARHTVEEIQAVRDHSGARAILFLPDASDIAAQHAVTFDAVEDWRTGCGRVLVSAVMQAEPEPVEETPGDRVAALLYTTGTTNAPKGVMLTHVNLRWNATASAELRSMSATDIVLGALPLSHIFGFSSTLFAVFSAGATVRFLPRFMPELVLQAFAEGITVLPAVPQMFERILAHLHATGQTLHAPDLRYMSAGGAPLDPDLKARAEATFGLPMFNGYGLTESTAGVAATSPRTPRDDVSVGPPFGGAKVWVDDPDSDGVGELVIEGDGVMKGYYRNPQATADALPRRGVFRSGDLGRIDADGTVFIEGRVKELIIRNGFNVYPPEIEAMLTRHEQVLQAAVVPRRDGANEQILAFVMALDGLTSAELAAWLKPRLVAYKQPQHIFVVDGFPIAPTGKVLKHKLISHFADLLAKRGEGQNDG